MTQFMQVFRFCVFVCHFNDPKTKIKTKMTSKSKMRNGNKGKQKCCFCEENQMKS